MKMVKFAAVMAGLLLVTQVLRMNKNLRTLISILNIFQTLSIKIGLHIKPTVIMKFLCNLELRRMEKLQILLL